MYPPQPYLQQPEFLPFPVRRKVRKPQRLCNFSFCCIVFALKIQKKFFHSTKFALFRQSHCGKLSKKGGENCGESRKNGRTLHDSHHRAHQRNHAGFAWHRPDALPETGADFRPTGHIFHAAEPLRGPGVRALRRARGPTVPRRNSALARRPGHSCAVLGHRPRRQRFVQRGAPVWGRGGANRLRARRDVGVAGDLGNHRRDAHSGGHTGAAARGPIPGESACQRVKNRGFRTFFRTEKYKNSAECGYG